MPARHGPGQNAEVGEAADPRTGTVYAALRGEGNADRFAADARHSILATAQRHLRTRAYHRGRHWTRGHTALLENSPT